MTTKENEMDIKPFIIKFAHLFPDGFLFFWNRWDERKRRFFIFNLIAGIAVSILLWYAYDIGPGYRLLNAVYDSLVTEDFRRAVLESEAHGKPPISDHIRIVAFKHTNGFWTPRADLGQTIFRAAELGAKVLVIDVDINTPVPMTCDKDSPADENQIFLEYLKKTADLARENQSILLVPRSETIRGAYGQQLEKLISDYRDVIKTGIVSAFKDTSDYQARHLRFYEKRGRQVYFSLQTLAALYFHYTPQAGDELLREKTAEILQGKEEVRIPFPVRHVMLFSQADPNAEHLEARYLFRLASREVTTEICGNVSDPLVSYPDLYLSPHGLFDRDEKIYTGKIVIIGTEDREIGDFHATPLGEMPGLYLMVNGINLILEGLQIHQPKWIIRVLIELLVIAVSAILGVYLPPTVSAPILAGIFFASFSSFSFWLFSKHCMFMDFWLPVAGIELCRLIVDILEFLKSFSKKRSVCNDRKTNQYQ